MLSITKYPVAMDALMEGRVADALLVLTTEGVDHENALALMAPPVQPKVGDVLVESWGYDQTNIDFYQVVAVTAKSVKVQHMHKRTVGATNGPQVDVVPAGVDPNAKVLLKRYHANPVTGRYHTAGDTRNAYGPHDPSVPCQETGWAYGH